MALTTIVRQFGGVRSATRPKTISGRKKMARDKKVQNSNNDFNNRIGPKLDPNLAARRIQELANDIKKESERRRK